MDINKFQEAETCNRKIKCKSNFCKTLTVLGAEFIGTACLVFFGCMGCIDWIQLPGIFGSNSIKLKCFIIGDFL